MESLGYVILYVRDLEASAAFYRDVVGLLIKLRDAGYAEFVTGQTRFGLLERTRASALIRREPAQGGPAGEVLFLVDDIDAEAERLRGLGVEFLSGPVDRPWGHRTLKGALILIGCLTGGFPLQGSLGRGGAMGSGVA